MRDTALSVWPSASRSCTNVRSGSVMRCPGALKGTSSVEVCPHSLHAHLRRDTSILALSMPRGRCQSVMGTCPLPSMDFPQQGHEGASFDISLPGTVRILARLWHLLVEVPNSSVRALSCGTSVCTNPSRCEGSWIAHMR
jgi:hypothetical protein